MKVNIIKGPMFKQNQKNAYRYLSQVLSKQAKESGKDDNRKTA